MPVIAFLFGFLLGVVAFAIVAPFPGEIRAEVCREAHIRHYRLESCKGAAWEEVVKYEIKP